MEKARRVRERRELARELGESRCVVFFLFFSAFSVGWEWKSTNN